MLICGGRITEPRPPPPPLSGNRHTGPHHPFRTFIELSQHLPVSGILEKDIQPVPVFGDRMPVSHAMCGSTSSIQVSRPGPVFYSHVPELHSSVMSNSGSLVSQSQPVVDSFVSHPPILVDISNTVSYGSSVSHSGTLSIPASA